MKRVLHVLGGLGTGGTETLIMNWYRHIDRTKVQFDFLVRSLDDNYSKEILEMGGRIYYTASFPRHFLRNYIETKGVLRKREWDVIHVHGNAAMYMLPLHLATKYKYNCRIMHSHSVRAKKSVFSSIHYLNRRKMSTYTTLHLACSKAAGKWMFGNDDFTIIRNAVDVQNYQFDEKARELIRKELNLEDKFVIGHVGRFASPKNHMFLLDVFKRLKEKKSESVLVLVGEGELENAVRVRAEELGLMDFVYFLGKRSDIGRIMSAMDLFLLPSIYEGLGNVLIEAQMNGLHCFVSQEAYNEEVQFLPNLISLSLKEGPEAWAEHIVSNTALDNNRHVCNETIENSGYDMRMEVLQLEKIYLQEKAGV